jgi:hypothetical protein
MERTKVPSSLSAETPIRGNKGGRFRGRGREGRRGRGRNSSLNRHVQKERLPVVGHENENSSSSAERLFTAHASSITTANATTDLTAAFVSLKIDSQIVAQEQVQPIVWCNNKPSDCRIDNNSSDSQHQTILFDDWEATRAIYADSQCGSRGSLGRMIVLRFLHSPRFTFLRPISHDMSSYRVWTLPREQHPTFQLEFEYANTTFDSLPRNVKVTLLNRYPHSWPADEELGWLEWLNNNAQVCLRDETAMSYSVCAWLENHAMDYFDLLYERDGYFLIQFQDRGPTFYDIETVVVSNGRMVRHSVNRRTEIVNVDTLFPDPNQTTEGMIHPFVLQKERWQPEQCKICLDSYLMENMERTPCGHSFCLECLSMHLSVKVKDIYTHRDNPFRCPDCSQGLEIIQFVKKYLHEDQMERVRTWYKDLKFPRCNSLPDCIYKSCSAKGSMRKKTIDSSVICCDKCRRLWCEWCLKRILLPDGHMDSECDAAACIMFCQRYLAASDKAKARCELKWPFIQLYAKARIENDSAEAWLKQGGGQACPVCKMGVQRDEGCFHIHCTCGAHFCYECGTELFYPFYGTHHCWERE